jgi:carboxymethylenebutenolidase
MRSYRSGNATVELEQYEPPAATATPNGHPAILILHGSGGAGSYWLDRFAPALGKLGVAAYAPHYLQKTGAQRATPEMILDGKHAHEWLAAIRDAISYVSERPGINAARIGLLGVSLGAYLAVALGIDDRRVRAVMELSGGLPPGWEARISPAMAPVLIVHGAADPVVPVAEAYRLEQALKQRGVTCETEIYPQEGHWFTSTTQARLLMKCAAFAKQYL